jgi:hypothetical protein
MSGRSRRFRYHVAPQCVSAIMSIADNSSVDVLRLLPSRFRSVSM